jgi:N-acetylneuraminic acid mutarotase
MLGTNLNDAIAAATYCYNVQTGAWATLAPMPEAMVCHTVCVINGLIYVLGGMFSDATAASSVHRYDPVANSWSTVAPLSSARAGCASFVLDGSIHVAGGDDGRQSLASVKRYEAIMNTWSTVTSMGQQRFHFGAHVMHVELNLFDSLMMKSKSTLR